VLRDAAPRRPVLGEDEQPRHGIDLPASTPAPTTAPRAPRPFAAGRQGRLALCGRPRWPLRALQGAG